MVGKIIAMVLTLSFIITGCSEKEAHEVYTSAEKANGIEKFNEEPDLYDKVAEYMSSVEKQSESIKESLEKDVLTQAEMNSKSQELYMLWDEALNVLWDELKNKLSEKEFAELQDAQRIWAEEKESKVRQAGSDVEGGSIYPLLVNTEAARLTEERVYELYELIKQVYFYMMSNTELEVLSCV